MAKQIDRQALAQQYLQLLQSGVPAADAFKQVYPNGIPTAAQQQAIDAKQKQSGALAATGGTIAGLLGLKYGMKGLESLGGGATTAALPGATTTTGVGAVAVPTGVSGALVPASTEASGLAFPSITASTAGPLAAAIGGTYLGGKAGLDMIQGKKPGLPGRVILGMATGGLSELGNSLLNRKTMRDVAKEHTKQLLGASQDLGYQNFVNGMRQQYNSAPTDPSKPFNGHETFSDYEKAGLQANNLTGVLGNLKLGPTYTALTPDQQVAFTQGQIAKNNYQSKKGEVDFKDEKTAQQDFANFISGIPRQASQTPVAVARPTPTTPTAISPALAKKQLAQTGQFGNSLLQAINK